MTTTRKTTHRLMRLVPISAMLKRSAAWTFALVAYPMLVLFCLAVVLACRTSRNTSRSPRLVWGPDPLIGNKYWSGALSKKGWHSKTFMFTHYSRINERGDFDLYIYDAGWWPALARFLKRHKWTWHLTPYVVFASFIYSLTAFDIFHHPYSGGILGRTPLWRLESFFLKLAGKKVVILPYGGDFYMYSRVVDTSLQHGLLLSYPQAACEEGGFEARVRYWTERADAVVAGFQIDGLGRWDLLPFNIVTIDVGHWPPKKAYSKNDGTNGPVRVLHTPNHKGFKGTEFLVAAVEELRQEGLLVELVLLEGVQNSRVREVVREADILAEQFVATAYAMSGMEGMASGLPVMANLENETYTRPFRRWSYLNECPILSTKPETIKENLRALVTDPALRETLGRAGRRYVEKYHSDETARYVFGAIYDRIWFGREDVESMDLFHPLTSEYNRRGPRVEHPLVENKIPVPRG